jgi:hypothetical protein
VWLDVASEKGPQDPRAHQSSLQQSLNDLPHGLQPIEVRLGHTIPPVWLGDRTGTREHGEWRVGIVPQEEQYFLPPKWRIGHHEVKVGINSGPGLDQDANIAQRRHFCVQALL